MAFLHRILANYRDLRTFGPSVFLRYIRDRRPVNLRGIGPVSLRRLGSDFECFRLVYQKGDYDIGAIPNVKRRINSEYRRILDSGSVPLIIDGGANIGASATWFAAQYPEAILKAVEPDPDNFKLLQANTASFPNIEPIKAAIGSEAGFVDLITSPERGDAVRTARSSAGLPVMTIADLRASVDQWCLFLVKVDIEGFEKDLFSSNLDWLDDVFVLAVELHDWMLPGERTSQLLLRAVTQRDFETFIVGENLFFVRVSN